MPKEKWDFSESATRYRPQKTEPIEVALLQPVTGSPPKFLKNPRVASWRAKENRCILHEEVGTTLEAGSGASSGISFTLALRHRCFPVAGVCLALFMSLRCEKHEITPTKLQKA
jgi:hypothetical protein